MKYLGIDYGRIIEGFCLLPSINLNWGRFEDEIFLLGNGLKSKGKFKKYYDIQFAWLWWYFTIGQIKNKLKMNGYY